MCYTQCTMNIGNLVKHTAIVTITAMVIVIVATIAFLKSVPGVQVIFSTNNKGLLVSDNRCDIKTQTKEDTENKVYFVGCGGFF